MPDVVRLLEGVVADQVRRHLARERDEGDRVHQRVLERGHQVGAGRPRRDQADSDLARRAGVAFRRMTRRSFLAHQDVPEPFEVVERVIDREDRAAGQPEDDVHPFPLQTLEQIRAPGASPRHLLTVLAALRFAYRARRGRGRPARGPAALRPRAAPLDLGLRRASQAIGTVYGEHET